MAKTKNLRAFSKVADKIREYRQRYRQPVGIAICILVILSLLGNVALNPEIVIPSGRNSSTEEELRRAIVRVSDLPAVAARI